MIAHIDTLADDSEYILQTLGVDDRYEVMSVFLSHDHC